MAKPKKGEVTIMVSSSVYGMEDDLRRIHALLKGFGYRVWMSHVGSVPKNPGKSAFEDCLIAVRKCDFFLGIIRNRYGSGRADKAEKSITHLEVLEAIKLKKPRWCCQSNANPSPASLGAPCPIQPEARAIGGAPRRVVI